MISIPSFTGFRKETRKKKMNGAGSFATARSAKRDYITSAVYSVWLMRNYRLYVPCSCASSKVRPR